MKRKDYISWQEYFMGMAFLSAQRSKDPSTQVGACVVGPDNRIIALGYNGFPNSCSDDMLPWGKEAEDELDTKYPYVVHAEANAIINASSNLNDCRMYVTLFPCSECAKLIIQSGIKHLVFRHEIVKPRYLQSSLATRKMFDLANVSYKKFTPSEQKLIIDFGEND